MHLSVDRGQYGEHVEAVCEAAPHLEPIAPLALVVETIHAIYAGALVVTPQQEHVVGEAELIAEEQTNGFDGV